MNKMEFIRHPSDKSQVTVTFSANALEAAYGSQLIEDGIKVYGTDWSLLAADTILPDIVFNSDFPTAITWKSELDQNASHEDLLQEAWIHAAIHFSNGTLTSVESAPSFNAPITLRAQALKAFISILPIEEIFPNHAWNAHLDESLAACYHTLAAYFIKLNDLESAQDCLKQSESLEDSPRALALRALISQAHGETLGAVANMVSSLQQYEQRKNPDAPHYVSFAPRDIEVVNEKLKDGLEALNRKDNETALNRFTEAVLNFDDFYQDLKLA